MNRAGIVAVAVLALSWGCSGTDGDPSSDADGDGTSGGAGTTDASTGPASEGSSTSQGSTSAEPPSTGSGTDDPSTTGADIPPPVLDECIVDGNAGDHAFTCDDLVFDVSVPPQCLEQACGLIVDVHGFTMSGRMQDNNTNLRALGVERGYIVIQPNAQPNPPNASWNPAIDDDKIVAFTERAVAAYHVDAARVHFTGFSQGGFMSWRMVCNHADLFASIAPAAACASELGVPDCSFEGEETPPASIPILYMHGTTDALVPFDCAEPRRDAVVRAFGLGPDAEMVSQSDGHTWTRHVGDAGAVLEFIVHDYAAAATLLRGHCYPGAIDPVDIPGQLFAFHCEEESSFVWGEAIIDFFEAHPKR